jgi:hypothetical protein
MSFYEGKKKNWGRRSKYEGEEVENVFMSQNMSLSFMYIPIIF